MDSQKFSDVSKHALTKTFTFINTNTHEVTAASARSTINSHIATVAHRRRQRRASYDSSIITFPLQSQPKQQSSEVFISHCPICSQTSQTVSGQGPCLHISEDGPSRQYNSRFQQGSVLAQGNSDPFNSFPIKIDSTVNHLLEFARVSCIPQVVRRNQQWSSDKRNKMPHRQPPSCPHEIGEDLCLGYLFLARYAALAASLGNVDKRIDIACMKFKGTASALLRTRLTNVGEMSDLGRRNDHVNNLGTNPWLSQVCWLIYLLSTVELSARNYEEAAIHTRMILNLLYSEDPSTKVVLRLDVINAISFWDVQRASVTLSRPCFDPDRWASDFLQITWESLVALKAPHESGFVAEGEAVGSSTHEPTLMWPFSKIHESRNIARTLPLLPMDSNTEEIRLHFSVWNNVYEAKMVNEILDMPKDTSSLAAPRAIYLACLYWLRRSMSSESSGPSKIAVAGTTLYDAGPAILQELNTIFENEKERITRARTINNAPQLKPGLMQRIRIYDEIQSDHSKLRLWVLYVSAMVERATVASARPQKFSVAFLAQALALRFTSWHQVRDDVLKCFLYDEELDRAGDSWFEHVTGLPLRQLQFF